MSDMIYGAYCSKNADWKPLIYTKPNHYYLNPRNSPTTKPTWRTTKGSDINIKLYWNLVIPLEFVRW